MSVQVNEAGSQETSAALDNGGAFVDGGGVHLSDGGDLAVADKKVAGHDGLARLDQSGITHNKVTHDGWCFVEMRPL